MRAAKAARSSTTKTSADIVFIYHALRVTPLQTVLIHFRSPLMHRVAQLVTKGKGVKAIGYNFIIPTELKKGKKRKRRKKRWLLGCPPGASRLARACSYLAL